MPQVSVSAQLSVRRGRAAVEFYKTAFGAEELHRVGGTDEDESVVAELRVGESTFWVADEAPEYLNFSPESLGGGSVRMLLNRAGSRRRSAARRRRWRDRGQSRDG